MLRAFSLHSGFMPCFLLLKTFFGTESDFDLEGEKHNTEQAKHAWCYPGGINHMACSYAQL